MKVPLHFSPVTLHAISVSHALTNDLGARRARRCRGLGGARSSSRRDDRGRWLVIAAIGTYLIAYRFYSRFLADRVFGLNDRRATPAERLSNGRDFVPTTRWVLFGHHFAAIAGAGPLVGPVLAAQFGYLPGTIWIVFGVVLGGAVQDFIILFGSMRRDGKSLGQMAKEEIGRSPASWQWPPSWRSWSSSSPCSRWWW